MSGCRGPSWPDAEATPGPVAHRTRGMPGTRLSLNSLGQVLGSSRGERWELETESKSSLIETLQGKRVSGSALSVPAQHSRV